MTIMAALAQQESEFFSVNARLEIKRFCANEKFAGISFLCYDNSFDY